MSDQLNAEAQQYLAAGKLTEALACYEEAVREDPTPAKWYNIGNVLRLIGRTRDAISAYDKSLALMPGFPQARFNRAYALLQIGDWDTGFREFEWRKVCPGYVDEARYRLPRAWRGESLAGKRLFIFSEQYQGDIIQFARYIRLAEQSGAEVILSAPHELHALLQTISSKLSLIGVRDIPGYDYQAALLSLPLLFRTRPDNVPDAQYLYADRARIRYWRSQIHSHGLKIGIIWQGSERAAERSFPLAMAVKALGRIPDVRIIALQKHSGLEQLNGCPTVETLDGVDECKSAFVDTAAAMVCCDIVVTPDTSTAHLAGALHVPTWLVLNQPADWRWLEKVDRSPWYPTMRVARQGARGDWSSAFAKMLETLDPSTDADI